MLEYDRIDLSQEMILVVPFFHVRVVFVITSTFSRSILDFKFHQHKSLISICNADINKVIVLNKVSFGNKGFKYFIGYKNHKKIWVLCIMLLTMNAYEKNFDETKYTSFYFMG